jgi:hypothetical protein
MQSTRTEIPAGPDAATVAERHTLLALAGTPRAEEAAALVGAMVAEEVQASSGTMVALIVDLDVGSCRVAVECAGAGDEAPESAWITAVGLRADRVGHSLTEAGQTVWFELAWPAE